MDRLNEEGMLDASSEAQIDLTTEGVACLATDPLLKLAAAISVLPASTQGLLAEALESVQDTLIASNRRPH